MYSQAEVWKRRLYEITWPSLEQRAQCSLEKIVTAYGVHFQMGGISSALPCCLLGRWCLWYYVLDVLRKTCLDQRCLCCQAVLSWFQYDYSYIHAKTVRSKWKLLCVVSILCCFRFVTSWHDLPHTGTLYSSPLDAACWLFFACLGYSLLLK